MLVRDFQGKNHLTLYITLISIKIRGWGTKSPKKAQPFLRAARLGKGRGLGGNPPLKGEAFSGVASC